MFCSVHQRAPPPCRLQLLGSSFSFSSQPRDTAVTCVYCCCGSRPSVSAPLGASASGQPAAPPRTRPASRTRQNVRTLRITLPLIPLMDRSAVRRARARVGDSPGGWLGLSGFLSGGGGRDEWRGGPPIPRCSFGRAHHHANPLPFPRAPCQSATARTPARTPAPLPTPGSKRHLHIMASAGLCVCIYILLLVRPIC